jgi:hypothetical protein
VTYPLLLLSVQILGSATIPILTNRRGEVRLLRDKTPPNDGSVDSRQQSSGMALGVELRLEVLVHLRLVTMEKIKCRTEVIRYIGIRRKALLFHSLISAGFLPSFVSPPVP